MGWFENVISMDGALQGRDRRDRQILFSVALACFIGAAGSSVMVPPAQRPPLVLAAYTLTFAGWGGVILACSLRMNITRRMVCACVATCCFAILLMDLNQLAISRPAMWPLFVLFADLALVLRLGRTFATSLILTATLWIIVSNAEVGLRFGLFDIPGTAPLSERIEKAHDLCDCESPPCAQGALATVAYTFIYLLVLLVDFGATRAFARAAEEEQASMARTIETVEAAAQLLAGYDVDTVAELLEAAEGRLPPAMHAALQRLEQNLRLYRPYLPAILLEQADSVQSHTLLPAGTAPGTATEEATIVFTDIRASTSVWEAAPEAMKKGIRTHNAVMREAVSLFGGYEVKTIGDSFMVAFERPCSGVDFGLAVQEALLAADWPAALLDVAICRPTAGLWGGLTVRVGVNHGPLVAETNTLTGRVDYFGHTVNVAARLEGVCLPGAVAVPSDLWERVHSLCLPAALGDGRLVKLRGVASPLLVHNVWPLRLQARRAHPLSVHTQALRTTPSQSTQSRELAVAPRLKRTHGTVATASLGTAPPDNTAEVDISLGLEAMAPLMEQSGGTLLTLLGECVWVGWNLGRPSSAHEESAVRFAQRLLRGGPRTGGAATLGIASGAVRHGDVGTTRQRFVTAAGSAVDVSLHVWFAAVEAELQCLYAAADGVPVGAVKGLLRLSEASAPRVAAVYELEANAWFNESAHP